MTSTQTLADRIALNVNPGIEHSGLLGVDETSIEVEIMGPLARLTISRKFVNPLPISVQAILGIPTSEHDDVVYGLTVRFGCSVWVVHAQGRRRAAKAYRQASATGGRAIKLERFDEAVKLVSIACVAPGEAVEVKIDSICQLGHLSESIQSLRLWGGIRGDSIKTKPETIAEHEIEGVVAAKLTVISAECRAIFSPDLVVGEIPADVDLRQPIELELRFINPRRTTNSVANREGDNTWVASFAPGVGCHVQKAIARSQGLEPPDQGSRDSISYVNGYVEAEMDLPGGTLFVAHQKHLGQAAKSSGGRAVRAFATASAHRNMQSTGIETRRDGDRLYDLMADSGWITPEVTLSLVPTNGNIRIQSAPSQPDIILVLVPFRKRYVDDNAEIVRGGLSSRIRRRRTGR